MSDTPISAALTSMLGLIKAQHRVDRAFLAWADKIEARVDALEAALADAVSGGDLLRTEIRDVLADQPDDVLTGGGRAFVTSPTAGPAHD